MIPEMPALIPASNLIPRPATSDEQLHKDLDDQIQIVKQIQTILGTEQMKLEMMIKQFNTENKKKNKGMETAADNVKPTQKRLRVCSPSSINRKQKVERSGAESKKKVIGVESP